jgi:low temperature requirement protein LtrA
LGAFGTIPAVNGIDSAHVTEKRASYLELFFDLVFVFAITQVSVLLHDQLTFAGLAEGALLLAMLWWTWSLYTWTTNWTGSDRLGIRVSLVGAMGASLLMAQAVPDAFDEAGPWFAVPYFVVRLFAASIYFLGARHHAAQRAALMTFLPLSMLASAGVLVGGYFDGSARVVIWVGAMLIDLASASAAGRATWEVDAAHFAERNGLFVIIALGESIVAIGLGASDAARTTSLALTLGLAFLGAAALWWCYFDRAARAAEGYLMAVTGFERGRFARDAYTILHYPVILGIVLYAFAAEEVVAHPAEVLAPEFRLAVTVGVSLVMLAVVAGTYRAVRRIPMERLLAALALLVLALVGTGIRADALMAVVVAIVVLALIRERTHAWPGAIGKASPD